MQLVRKKKEKCDKRKDLQGKKKLKITIRAQLAKSRTGYVKTYVFRVIVGYVIYKHNKGAYEGKKLGQLEGEGQIDSYQEGDYCIIGAYAGNFRLYNLIKIILGGRRLSELAHVV